MSCETPRRLSLRKRNSSEVNDGNQVKRKSSSAINQNKNAHPSDSTPDHVSVEHHKVRCASPRTPKTHRKEPKNALYRKIPPTSKETQKVSNPEASPTSPFSLSQMPCTQECEVVWDCNSPGFSKEDLKKMCNKRGEKTFTPSPIAPLPKQPLLSHIRPPDQMWARDGGSSTSTMVAATLDNLLAKVNSEHLKRIENENEKLSGENIHESFNDSNLFKSSQPFEVSNLESNFSFSEEELNELACLDNQGSDSPHIIKQTKTNGDLQAKPPIFPVKENVHCKETQIFPKPKVGIKCKETNGNFSPSEDYFNESFLKATQAIEDDYFTKTSATSHHPLTTIKNLPLSPLSKIRTKKPVILFPKMDKSAKSEKFIFSSKDTDTHLRSSIPVVEQQRSFLNNQKSERSSAQAKQNTSNPKPNVNLDTSKVITNNKNIPKTTTSKVAGSRMSFQLNGQDKNVPQNSNIFHNDKRLSKKSCGMEENLNKEKHNLKIQGLPIHQAELTGHQSLASCMGTTHTSPLKFPTIIKSTSKPANPPIEQQAPVAKGGNFPIKSHPVTNQSLEDPFKTSREFDEDDFLAMMPSLIQIEAEYSLGITNTGVNAPKLGNNGSKTSLNKEEDPSLRSYPTNNISSIENVGESFKRNLFSERASSTLKIDGANNMAQSNKITLNSLTKSPKKCKKMSSALSEAMCTAGSTKYYHNFDNTTGVKSDVIDHRPNLPNQLVTSDQADDGFGDDDDLFLQEDVLESINLIESQYMASQKTSVKKSPLNSTSVGSNTSSLVFQSEDNFSLISSKSSEVSPSFKKKMNFFENPQSIPVTKEKEKHNFKKKRFGNHIDIPNKETTPDGKETLPVAPSEGGVSDDDLLKIVFDKNPFEDEFDLPMANTNFPSPDFGKPFKPPAFVNSQSTSITRTCTSRDGYLKVGEYPLSSTPVVSKPSVSTRLTDSKFNETGFRTTTKNVCNSKVTGKGMTSNRTTWDLLNLNSSGNAFIAKQSRITSKNVL